MTQDVMQWLQSQRKLDGALLADMGVRAFHHEHLGAAVAFPYRVKGKAVAAKFRTINKRFLSSKGVQRGLYNIDALSDDLNLPIVITEGEIDCLSAIQAGFQRAVSLPDGWTAQGNKTEALTDALEALLASPYVIVAGDNDEAGESLPRTVATILAGHDVRYAQWPEGCKDANDVLMIFGEGTLAKCLNEAKRIDPPGGTITGFSDLPPLSQQRILKIGRAPFDRVIALELGEVSVWTGLPGHGKSTLVTWVGDEVSKAENIRVGMIGFETHPFRIRDQLSRSMAHRAWRDLSADERKLVLADLDKRWRIVHASSESDHHLGWLEAMVRTLAVRDQCKVIIIDPWNELEHLPEKGESMTSYINFALKTIRNWAKSLEIHICVVAHPAKIKSDGKPRPPTGYDVADSAAFFNKPGLGITVHPGEGEHDVDIINWKTRDTMLYGTQRGAVTVEFAPVWGSYRAKGEPAEQPELGAL